MKIWRFLGSMNFPHAKFYVKEDLENGCITPQFLLDRFKFLDENSRESYEYTDPNHIPYYYYLGKHFKSDSLLEFGFGLGLFGCCYVLGNPDVKSWLAFQEKTEVYYSHRIAISNVREVYSK